MQRQLQTDSRPMAVWARNVSTTESCSYDLSPSLSVSRLDLFVCLFAQLLATRSDFRPTECRRRGTSLASLRLENRKRQLNHFSDGLLLARSLGDCLARHGNASNQHRLCFKRRAKLASGNQSQWTHKSCQKTNCFAPRCWRIRENDDDGVDE